jgi:hypothetical protein
MAHVTALGLFPPSWYPLTVNGIAQDRVFRQVTSIASELSQLGFSFTPRELANFYWNCRRLSVTATFQWKFYLTNGSAYSVASPISHTYKVPMFKLGNSSRAAEFQKYQERLLIKGSENVPGSNSVWDPRSLREYDHGVIGSPQGLYKRSRLTFRMLDDYHAYHVDPIVADATDARLWPSISCAYSIFGSGATSNFTITPLNDGSSVEQRGLFHFFDFPAVPLYLIAGAGTNASLFFQQNQTTADITVSWPQGTPEERAIYRWPYASSEEAEKFARYSDGLDGDPDEFGNW